MVVNPLGPFENTKKWEGIYCGNKQSNVELLEMDNYGICEVGKQFQFMAVSEKSVTFGEVNQFGSLVISFC